MIYEATEAVMAQAPMLNTYIEAAYLRWETSHGPEIGRAALESARSMHPAERVLLPAYIALQSFELSSGNETWITNAGAKHFAESGGQDIWGSAWEVAQRTAALEVPLAVLSAWALFRMRPAARAIYNNYLEQPTPLTEDEKTLLASAKHSKEEKSSILAPLDKVLTTGVDKLAHGVQKIKDSSTVTAVKHSRAFKFGAKTGLNYGLAMSTGTGGVEISKDLAEGGETTTRKNLVRGFLAATAIVGTNYAIGAGFTASIKHDLPVLKDVCQFAIDWLKTPLIAATIFTGLGLRASRKKQTVLLARAEARGIEAEQISAPNL